MLSDQDIDNKEKVFEKCTKYNIYYHKLNILPKNLEFLSIELVFHQILSWFLYNRHTFHQLILLHLYQSIFNIFMRTFLNTSHTQRHYNYSRSLQVKEIVHHCISTVLISKKQHCQYSDYKSRGYFFHKSHIQEQNNFNNILMNSATDNEQDKYIIHL